MLRFYENAPTLLAEQDQFEEDIKDFVRGKINPIKFKAIRVAHGVYEQRQRDTYMIRIRCAAGGITPDQLRKTAQLAEQYGSGEVHFTTRQEVQVHDVLIQNLLKVIRGLNEVGLSSRGGGGNTIRNILTSADSGIDPETDFDVDPYAIALTTRLINEEDSWNLPRKFKIAMSHNTKDSAYTQATCLGYVAETRNGQKGFRVYCSGGMGAKPMVGHELIDWIPDTQVYHVARALKSMFDVHGNRRSKFSSRIKFLWKKMGDEDFKKAFHEYYDQIKDDASLNLTLPVVENKANSTIQLSPETVSTPEFEEWKARFVFDQLQPGLKDRIEC
jgi:sulfite reductase (ferredoxin)